MIARIVLAAVVATNVTGCVQVQPAAPVVARPAPAALPAQPERITPPRERDIAGDRAAYCSGAFVAAASILDPTDADEADAIAVYGELYSATVRVVVSAGHSIDRAGRRAKAGAADLMAAVGSKAALERVLGTCVDQFAPLVTGGEAL